MDWTQTITLGLTLIAYMTGMCMFFYHLNEKNIEKLEKRLETNEAHWREMFMHFNKRFDKASK